MNEVLKQKKTSYFQLRLKKDSFKKFTDHFSNMNQELTVVKNSNIAFDLDTSEDLDLLTLEQRNKLFKDNDN